MLHSHVTQPLQLQHSRSPTMGLHSSACHQVSWVQRAGAGLEDTLHRALASASKLNLVLPASAGPWRWAIITTPNIDCISACVRAELVTFTRQTAATETEGATIK